MTKWEYLFLSVKAEEVHEESDRRGMDGWELVSVLYGFCQYNLAFKRPIPADQTL